MSDATEANIYVARLTKSEKDSLFTQDKAFPAANLRAAFQQTVTDVCIDRVILSAGCLALAERLAADGSSEEDLRTAVGRAYYCIHHSLRVMTLFQNNWDPDGHEESIKEFKSLLRDNRFCGQTGLSAYDGDHVQEALRNRHVADYSPYNIQRVPNVFGLLLTITGENWSEAAEFNIVCARKIHRAALKFIGLEE